MTKEQTMIYKTVLHTHKTKYMVTRIPLETGGELRYSGQVSRSCYKHVTRRVALATNKVRK
jgi:hypothetical protein